VSFAQEKEAALRKLAVAKQEGSTDPGAMAVVDLVNTGTGTFTTSSCAGRIALMEVPDEDRKRSSRWLGKWHGPVGTDELTIVLSPPPAGPVWLFVQGAILHVTCRDLEVAKRLLDRALSAGHKSSGVKGLGHHPVVEVRSTETMALPLIRNGTPLADEGYVRAVTEEANRLRERAELRLGRLERELEGWS
jgi:tRNA wybutosine-synthesizing protein 3